MSEKPTTDAPTLAKLFNVTDARIRQLAGDGVIIRAARGRYDLWGSIRGYIKFLQDRRINQWDQGEAGGDWQKERARLTRAKADMAEMQAAILKGTVHEAKAVEEVWTDHLLACRSKLRSMPKKLAPRLHGVAKLTTIEMEIEAAITEALNELASYDPALVTDRYVSAHRQELDAAAEVDDEPVVGLDPKAQS